MTTLQLLDSEAVLSALIHAKSKEGKSTLASTAPPPILVLDAEGSWKYIREAGFKSGMPLRKITWDPMRDPPPRHDETWEVCIVSVTDYGMMEQIYRSLTQSEHDFVSIIMDSVTEVQRRCKANLKGIGEQMKQQDWGMLLDKMSALVRAYRDLTLIKDNSVRCVLFIAETKLRDGVWVPYMQGQLADSMPYWIDLLGWLYTYFADDGDGQPTVKKKVLHIGSSDMWLCGERVQGALPDAILDPNITTMMNTIFPKQ
jgi:AAA domain